MDCLTTCTYTNIVQDIIIIVTPFIYLVGIFTQMYRFKVILVIFNDKYERNIFVILFHLKNIYCNSHYILFR